MEKPKALVLSQQSDNATLPTYICVFLTHYHITKIFIILINLFITVGGDIDASLEFSFEVSVESVSGESPSLPTCMILASSISMTPTLVIAIMPSTTSAVPATEMIATLTTIAPTHPIVILTPVHPLPAVSTSLNRIRPLVLVRDSLA